MDGTNSIARFVDQPALDAIADPLSEAVQGVYKAAGPVGARLKNAMHGVWLKHPLHPVLTDLPLGAWTTGLVLDALATSDDGGGMERAADIAMAVGLAGALGAAVTGLTDWSETFGRSKRTGLVHGLLNITATMLYATAYALRKTGSRATGQRLAVAGYGIAVGAAWLGGDLVYGQRIGVTHASVEPSATFTPVAQTSDLAEQTMMRARKDDLDVLLVRQRGRACALAHPCSHLGGPLSEGTLKEGSVVCPWHGSEFALADGAVLNGPATQDQPSFDVIERNGAIEVKPRD